MSASLPFGATKFYPYMDPAETEVIEAEPIPDPEPDIKERIIESIGNGITMLRLEKQAGFPSRQTVLRWRNADKEFDDAITRAYQEAGASLADEAIELARATANSGGLKAAANRVTIDTLKWASSKFYPKMFGDREHKTEVNVGIDNRTVVVSPEKRAELQAKLKELQDSTPDS